MLLYLYIERYVHAQYVCIIARWVLEFLTRRVQNSLYFINEINILEGKFCTVQPRFCDIKLSDIATVVRPISKALKMYQKC